MRHARGDAAQRGQAFADLQLRVDALERIEIAQRHQRAHALAIFLNGLHADADAPLALRGLQFRFRGDFAQLVAFNVQHLAQRMSLGKISVTRLPKKLPRRRAQKFLRRGADHHGARVAREQKQAVFQAGHHGVHVFAHGAENFMHAAQLLADLRDLPADLAQFVAASARNLSPPALAHRIARRKYDPIARKCRARAPASPR